MSIRVIQVAGSNTLHKAKTPEELRSEIRELTVKLNEALRQISQLLAAAGVSLAEGNVTVINNAGDVVTTIDEATFARHFEFMDS